MLSDSQVLTLATELNHLLWSDDPPQMTPDVAEVMRNDPMFELSRVNMHCVAHSAVCAGLMLRMGETVTTRCGSALVVYPEQKQFEKPHFVMKHWWMTTSTGLCDFSLNLNGCSAHRPVIYANRNVADPCWKVSFKHDFRRSMEEAEKCHTAKVCGVFYQTDNKMSVTQQEFEPEMAKTFSAARKRNVPLRFIDIIDHCERLLGGGQSLKGLPQEQAWRHLAKGENAA
jgi:hypothetical protein